MPDHDYPTTEIDPADLVELGADARQHKYAKGEIIFQQGDLATHLYIIVAGQVAITLLSPGGDEIVLAQLQPNEVFGELALLDRAPRSATATAAVPSHLLLLPGAAFHQLLAHQPVVTRWLLRVLCRRLRQDVQAVQDLAFLDVPARLAKTLVRLAATHGRHSSEGVVITCRLSQAELGRLVGATRESVNKCLRAYESQGIIRRQQGQITVLRAEDLRRRAGELLSASHAS
jgi:CRP/FNR family transcriptional regulator, cyclic AMP receptor protein